ncbi:MAG: hydrogenase small subunit [Candidatus Riflebacteria bacterium]|nr:hydrogenase small subunit [Candidatus Riflebacteria bacterium]
MLNYSRRDFLKYCGKLAVLFGLTPASAERLTAAVDEIAARKSCSLWLQGLSCSGCSVSLLNSAPLGIAEILTKKVPLAFNSTVSAATGEIANKVIKSTTAAGDYFLIVEGAVPSGMSEACVSGGVKFSDQLIESAANSIAVFAVGTCASYGGIAAGEGNPTGAMGIPDFLKAKGVNKKVVVIPGCPVHPDWLVGSLSYAVAFGVDQLKLDAQGKPLAFFSGRIHEKCPLLPDFQAKKFAKFYSDKGCLLQLGCKGPRTVADCNSRLWNGETNTCIKAGAPCLGCATNAFPAKRNLSFRFVEDTFLELPGGASESDLLSK